MTETKRTRTDDTPTSARRRATAAGLAPLLAFTALTLVACGRDTSEGSQPGRAAPTATAAALPSYGPLARIPPSEGEEWTAAIDWQPYEAGMKRARAENKPVCLVVYADWCSHCRTYSHVFEDPRVIEKARGFVMIRVNSDDEEEVSRRYARDGTYVPRTFFLAPDGTLQADIHGPRPKYAYFFDEHNPASLLGGMEKAARAAAP